MVVGWHRCGVPAIGAELAARFLGGGGPGAQQLSQAVEPGRGRMFCGIGHVRGA